MIAKFIIIYFLFHGINILFAWINRNIVQSRMSTGKQINHFAWGSYYTVLCGLAYLWQHDWFLVSSIVLLHLSIFPVFYNRFRGLYTFNLSPTSKAITDKIQVAIGFKNSKVANIGSQIISLILFAVSIAKLYHLI